MHKNHKHHNAMKTRTTRLLLLLATVFTFGLAQAAEPFRKPNTAKRTSMERTLERALNNNLSYPLFEKGDMNGEVTVSLVIDKEGKVVVLESHSANEALRAYVLRKLARIDIGDNPEGSWKTTHIRFRFHPEKS
jgi:hypothetical protein